MAFYKVAQSWVRATFWRVCPTTTQWKCEIWKVKPRLETANRVEDLHFASKIWPSPLATPKIPSVKAILPTMFELRVIEDMNIAHICWSKWWACSFVLMTLALTWPFMSTTHRCSFFATQRWYSFTRGKPPKKHYMQRYLETPYNPPFQIGAVGVKSRKKRPLQIKVTLSMMYKMFQVFMTMIKYHSIILLWTFWLGGCLLPPSGGSRSRMC